MIHLSQAIESLLFVSSKPLSLKQLAHHTGSDPESVRGAVLELLEKRAHTGIVVTFSNDLVQLATHPEAGNLVTEFLQSDMREKLTDASMEVLTIIAYKQPVSKAEIEAIRGVNSQYGLRALLMRGMIEKIADPHDQRSYLYRTTNEFLQHLGLQSNDQLPEFQKISHVLTSKDTKEDQTQV